MSRPSPLPLLVLLASSLGACVGQVGPGGDDPPAMAVQPEALVGWWRVCQGRSPFWAGAGVDEVSPSEACATLADDRVELRDDGTQIWVFADGARSVCEVAGYELVGAEYRTLRCVGEGAYERAMPVTARGRYLTMEIDDDAGLRYIHLVRDGGGDGPPPCHEVKSLLCGE